jgi:hypothetical protein
MSAACVVAIELEGDAHGRAEQVVTAMATPIVLCCMDLSADQRVLFWQGLFATLSGMAEASLGHDTTRTLLESKAALKPTGANHPLQ